MKLICYAIDNLEMKRARIDQMEPDLKAFFITEESKKQPNTDEGEK